MLQNEGLDALKLISVDSSFLIASTPDMCLYSKTYNYLWADITIRMHVVIELHLNEFMVYIYEYCSSIKHVLFFFKHQRREDAAHALIQNFSHCPWYFYCHSSQIL